MAERLGAQAAPWVALVVVVLLVTAFAKQRWGLMAAIAVVGSVLCVAVQDPVHYAGEVARWFEEIVRGGRT